MLGAGGEGCGIRGGVGEEETFACLEENLRECSGEGGVRFAPRSA